MTDLHLTDLAIRAQEDARRCYQIYKQHRLYWENCHEDDEAGSLSDLIIWQYRASLAAEHALKMLEIVTR